MMTGKNALLKVVILGDGAVGKSCLMQRYVNDKFDERSFHTIGVEFLNKDIYIDDKTFTLQIWDTAGQERFRSLRTPFYRGSDLCLLVFGLDDRESLNNLAKWKEEFVQYADIKNPSSFPFVVLGNKADLEGERVVQPEEGLAWCRDNGGLPYIETSAKECMNVEKAFVTAVRAWASLEDKQEKLCDNDTISLFGVEDPSDLEEPLRFTTCCSSFKS